jgi:hypothetical protein
MKGQNMSKENWSVLWPEEEGYYWFYGWPYEGEKERGNKPEMNVVQVMKVSNGNIVSRNGSIWWKFEYGVGMFLKMNEPKIPF